MESIETLEKTTFMGRRFTRKQLTLIQETVNTFENLSRTELSQTICEILNWKTPRGTNKTQSGLLLLKELEDRGIIILPTKRQTRAPVWSSIPLKEAEEPVNECLAAIEPISLHLVTTDDERTSWKSAIETYHYLGYKRPIGSHLCYFIVSEKLGQKLGCMLFSASASWTLSPRDQWIGWDKQHREKLIHLVLTQNRFLIFPWVSVPHLASHALSKAIKQIGEDWLRIYKYQPVLIETFVDTTKARFSGACYKAANWQYLGKTKGCGFDPHNEKKKTAKDIYIYPLQKDWKQSLTNIHRQKDLKKKYRNDLQSSNTRKVNDGFIMLWEKVVHIIGDVAAQYDEKWQVRKRLIDTMLLILLIFRLVSSKNTQSYNTTIDELWDNCDRFKLPLPQKSVIASSSFCAARKKLDEDVFKRINNKIIETYEHHDDSYRWFGHRLFAVDGSKVNLPRDLLSYGYNTPSENSNYPQGLLSCLYQLKSQLPYDFDLVNHSDERLCAKHHLQAIKKNDVVVYDRGYFSYVMLHQHITLGIHAIFRLQEYSFSVIKDFFTSEQTDLVTTICPLENSRSKIIKKHPEIAITPLQIRLIKYHIGNDVFCLGTTLVNQEKYNSTQAFADVYHARWGVEELYKTSKRIYNIEDFHGKSERGVKQELFAHFVLITMNRIFTNQADVDLNQIDDFITPTRNSNNSKQVLPNVNIGRIKANFKNCIHVFTKSIEELLLYHAKIKTTVEKAFQLIVGRYQKERPGRSYIRKSMRPISKWLPTKKKKKKLTVSEITI